MVRRLGVFGSAGALLASTFVAVATLGMSAAHAASFEDWANVSAGGGHTCGVRSNGKLYCWGSDESGQIGDGADHTLADTPRRIGTFEDWATVAAGDSHTCGIRRNGKLYCWGLDNNGQIGDGGSDSDVTAPVRVGTFEDWASVSAGQFHTCGVRSNGKLYCWGSDNKGQIGDGETPGPVNVPRRIGTFEDWASASAGYSHTCGVRRNGKLYCWGFDNSGQIGDGDGVSPDLVIAPRRIGSFEDWANASAGGSQTCGVRKNGKLYCWGNDDNGQLGNGGLPSAGVDTPHRIGTFEDWAIADADLFSTCGVRKNGKLYCWGNDDFGQVGDGDTLGPATSPHRIGSFEDWADASTGIYHTCGVRTNGKLYCWGQDADGQVGDGVDDTPDTVPHRI